MTVIGVGDVVEALAPNAAHGLNVGDRATVFAVLDDGVSDHGCAETVSIFLWEYPAMASWCVCVWRKIGGSKSATVARFAEDLNPTRRAPRSASAA